MDAPSPPLEERAGERRLPPTNPPPCDASALHVPHDFLNLIVEIRGFRGEDAKEKANTMRTCWVPRVNNLGKFGRWAFADFRSVFEIDSDFDKFINKIVGKNDGNRE